MRVRGGPADVAGVFTRTLARDDDELAVLDVLAIARIVVDVGARRSEKIVGELTRSRRAQALPPVIPPPPRAEGSTRGYWRGDLPRILEREKGSETGISKAADHADLAEMPPVSRTPTPTRRNARRR